MKVKRYDIGYNDMESTEDGDYVLYNDYKVVLDALDEVVRLHHELCARIMETK